MRVTKHFKHSGALPALALLLLLPLGASAQTFNPGWYQVNSEELVVRNRARQLVMGTLTNRSVGPNLYSDPVGADRFYIYFWRPGLTYAWGYADGKGFKNCGWVGVRSSFAGRVKNNLVRSSSQPPPPGKCVQYQFINESVFAARMPSGHRVRPYTNYSPPPDGSGAEVVVARTWVWGNYTRNSSSGQAYNKLKEIMRGYPVRWRHFTKDKRYVMVGLGRRPRGKRRRGSLGDWGYVKCTDIGPLPDPSDREDRERFRLMCQP